VVIEPAVVEAFPTERAVNEALNGVLNTARAVRDTGGLPPKKRLSLPTKKRRVKGLRQSRG
jgi:hypothetical protein